MNKFDEYNLIKQNQHLNSNTLSPKILFLTQFLHKAKTKPQT